MKSTTPKKIKKKYSKPRIKRLTEYKKLPISAGAAELPTPPDPIP